jgi:hypothetical protein
LVQEIKVIVKPPLVIKPPLVTPLTSGGFKKLYFLLFRRKHTPAEMVYAGSGPAPL